MERWTFAGWSGTMGMYEVQDAHGRAVAFLPGPPGNIMSETRGELIAEMVVGTADPDDALDWTHMAAAAVRAALAKGG